MSGQRARWPVIERRQDPLLRRRHCGVSRDAPKFATSAVMLTPQADARSGTSARARDDDPFMSPTPDSANRPARILIVDDERHNRQLLQVMLGPEGFELLTAQTGEEALALIAQHQPDLVLLDIMMPGIDGYQVTGRIKGDVATRNIPVVLITALDDRDSRIRGLNAGAEDFLTKPIDRVELCVRVRNLLRLKAYGDYQDRYGQMLEVEVGLRTADLLERTRALERQAAVLSEQAALLDLAQDAIIVCDMEQRILFWNRGAEIIYGWPSHEVARTIHRNPAAVGVFGAHRRD